MFKNTLIEIIIQLVQSNISIIIGLLGSHDVWLPKMAFLSISLRDLNYLLKQYKIKCITLIVLAIQSIKKCTLRIIPILDALLYLVAIMLIYFTQSAHIVTKTPAIALLIVSQPLNKAATHTHTRTTTYLLKRLVVSNSDKARVRPYIRPSPTYKASKREKESRTLEFLLKYSRVSSSSRQ